MIWKSLRKVLSASAVTLALVLGASVSANADTTGGIGGGGGAGGAFSGFEWVSVTGNKGTVYDEFVRLGQWGSQTDSLVNNRIGGNGVGVCRDSSVIWFIRSAQGGWTYNYTGATHGPSAGNVVGSIEWPYSQYGPRGPIAAETQAFKDWDRGQNRNQIDSTPGYTIICSGKFMQDPITWSDSSTRYIDTDDNASYREPYSWTTDVKRQSLTNDGGIDPIGANNLHDQTNVKKTEFGKLYDTVNTAAGAGIGVDDLRNKVAAAKAADAAANRATVDLDDKNKAGMAEGGILNVIDNVRWATITAYEHRRTTITTTCDYRREWNSYNASYDAATSVCRDATSGPVITRNSSKDAPATLELKGFWQMLSVHCNIEEFNALLASDPSLIKIQTPDVSNKMSGVVYTKNYNRILSPRELDFAPSGTPMKGLPSPDPAKVRTGDLGFYDKECPFDCTNSNAPADGASASNGATNNSGNSGAVSNKVNANAFEFFRDNSTKDLTIDTWYPVSGGAVTYKGEAPVTTTVIRDVNGTPSLDGSSGGKFIMKSSKDGSALFTGSATIVNTQKNWDDSTFSSSMATILNGLHNKFTVQSTWASDAGKPQAFNFKWEYEPNVSTTIPLTGIGFGPGDSQKIGTTGNVETPIQGKCYTYFVPNAKVDTTASFGANTGTGTQNNLDGQLLTDTIAKLTTNFVRSTTE